MIGFIGEYEVTLDAKGRFLLPAAFKKQLEEGENQFVINQGIEKCLTLYPLKTWEPIFLKISKLNDFDPKVRAFRRIFMKGVAQLELDSAGRLLISKSLSEFAGLKKDIVLISAFDKIEIWDKTEYDEYLKNYSRSEYSQTAEIVMVEKPDTNKSV